MTRSAIKQINHGGIDGCGTRHIVCSRIIALLITMYYIFIFHKHSVILSIYINILSPFSMNIMVRRFCLYYSRREFQSADSALNRFQPIISYRWFSLFIQTVRFLNLWALCNSIQKSWSIYSLETQILHFQRIKTEKLK